MAALEEELACIREDRAVRVVVLAGAGPAFCAGHDLRELRSEPGRESYERLFAQCSRLMQVIARAHGVATAAGSQLVATCDLAVVAEDARFATPGVHIGLFCSTPMVALSRNVGRKQAMEMLLLGELIDAPTALRLGLVNRVVPASSLDEEVARITQASIGKSPLTLRIGKEVFYRQLERPVAEAYDYAGRVTIENMLARDAEEGIDAFLAKRAPVWSGT
jgi:enoyl-CoA hydratase/carnithine racemase